jgi:hypothetical protein
MAKFRKPKKLTIAYILSLMLFISFIDSNKSSLPSLLLPIDYKTRDVMSVLQASTSCSYSALWGQKGELWNTSRLPDFSKAGYRGGQTPPSPAVTQTISASLGNGTNDATAAFQTALNTGGTIYIPAGTYKITRRLNFTKSNTILRGAGQNQTTLYFPKHLTDAEGAKPCPDSQGITRSCYSWEMGFISAMGVYNEIGIEDITIEFPQTQHLGHLKELGFNGIYFWRVSNSWARNVAISNFDLGISLDYETKFNTLQNITFKGRGGHHGLLIKQGENNLITNFSFLNKSVHDISLSYNSNHNVFSKGSGLDINFDHHGNNPYDNLFSNINIGQGTRPWHSSGGHSSGPRETFWNIRKGDGTPLSLIPGFGLVSSKGPIAPQVNVIGFSRNQINQTSANEYIEGLVPANMCPQDLHTAQLCLRQGKCAQPPPTPTPTIYKAPTPTLPSLEKLLFKEDFETGNFNKWPPRDQAFCCDYSGNIITTPSRLGNYAARFELRHTDPLLWSGTRSQLTTPPGWNSIGNIGGADEWYTYSLYLPPGYQSHDKAILNHGIPNQYQFDNYEILAEWHAHRDNGEVFRSPNLHHSTENGQWKFEAIHSNKQIQTANDGTHVPLWKIPYKTGVWTDWIVHVRWDYQTNGQGLVEIWYQTDRGGWQKIVNYKGPNSYNDHPSRGGGNIYFVWGIYKPWWNRDDLAFTVHERTAYMDHLHIFSSGTTLQQAQSIFDNTIPSLSPSSATVTLKPSPTNKPTRSPTPTRKPTSTPTPTLRIPTPTFYCLGGCKPSSALTAKPAAPSESIQTLTPNPTITPKPPAATNSSSARTSGTTPNGDTGFISRILLLFLSMFEALLLRLRLQG